MAGQTLSFTEADLAASAKAYDPQKHEAPIVVGHPTHDGPAYGWVGALSAIGNALEATPTQINPEFAEQVANGAYKKISASFYAPDAPGNPVPGVYYLRHVGFLGAQPPAIKGLRSPSFAEGEAGVVEFGESAYDDMQVAQLFRNLREWLIGEKGAAVADSVVPSYILTSLDQSAQGELQKAQPDSGISPMFSETHPPKKESTVTDAEAAALKAQNDALQAQLNAANAAAHATANAAALAGHTAFCEALASKAQLPTAAVPVLAQALHALSPVAKAGETPAVVEFSEGEGTAKTTKPLADALKGVLQGLPAQVQFGEAATKGRAAAGGAVGTVDFAAPAGLTADAEQSQTLALAQAYMATHKVDLISAVQAVQQGKV
jgi:hypothetical protein